MKEVKESSERSERKRKGEEKSKEKVKRGREWTNCPVWIKSIKSINSHQLGSSLYYIYLAFGSLFFNCFFRFYGVKIMNEIKEQDVREELECIKHEVLATRKELEEKLKEQIKREAKETKKN